MCPGRIARKSGPRAEEMLTVLTIRTIGESWSPGMRRASYVNEDLNTFTTSGGST